MTLYLTLLCVATITGEVSLYRINNPVDLLRLSLNQPTASVRQEDQKINYFYGDIFLFGIEKK